MPSSLNATGTAILVVNGAPNKPGSSSPYLSLVLPATSVASYDTGECSLQLSLGISQDGATNFVRGTVGVSRKGAQPSSETKPIGGGGGAYEWGVPLSGRSSSDSVSGSVSSNSAPVGIRYTAQFDAPMVWDGATLTVTVNWTVTAQLIG